MNWPWKRPAGGAPVPEPAYEAMAAELNGRGTAYAYVGLWFPPGEWVAVTTDQAERLAWHEAITVRAKDAPGEENANV